MKRKRLGEINYNNKGCLMKIVEYNSYADIIVEFQDEYKARINTTYQNFQKGEVKNPYNKEVYNVGYLGQGKYSYKEHKHIYKIWQDMLKRCYSSYYMNKYPTYKDCYVCEEWHNFQNFAKWLDENYYEVKDEKMCLDKDILFKRNKIYSPETCIFVPERINNLFVNRHRERGNLPLGVIEDIDKRSGSKRLKVQCNMIEEGKTKRKNLGRFPLNRPFQAFYTYKQFKESYIKQIADEYKELIPQKLYNALYRYEVEIND